MLRSLLSTLIMLPVLVSAADRVGDFSLLDQDGYHHGMSWYDDHWTHNGFVDRKHGWTQSAKEWVMRTGNNFQSHNMFTENAKLFVNSVCKNYNLPILQFNALGQHKTTVYENYYADGYTMDSMLKRAEQEDSNKILFANDGHPNEQGHKYFAKRLHLFAKERIIQ